MLRAGARAYNIAWLNPLRQTAKTWSPSPLAGSGPGRKSRARTLFSNGDQMNGAAETTNAELSLAIPEVTEPVKVAVGQMTSVGDQEANFRTCEQLAEKAASESCSMLFLPECFAFIGENQQESLSKVQPVNGTLMERYCDMAKRHNLWLSLGGFQETGPDPKHLYNTHVIVNNEGGIAARYRKIHLFDVDVPNGPVLMESRTTAPGNAAVVCDSPVGRLGVTVCYDLRFPELYQKLTWEMGAHVLLVPSAFTRITGEAHWEVLLRARAIECQAYVVAAAQAGRHNEKRESYGHALIIDPWGTVVARLEDSGATGIATTHIDLNKVRSVRIKMPIQLHRRKGQAAYLDAPAAPAAPAATTPPLSP